MNEEQALATIDRALGFATADEVEVSVSSNRERATRFANNAIIQNVSSLSGGASVSVAFGQRVGRARTNDLSDEGLRQLLARAEALATQAAPDTEYVPPPGPQQYRPVESWCPATVAYGLEERAAAIAEAVQPSERAGYRAAGSYTTHETLSAIGNSRGLRGQHRATWAYDVQTVLTDDSSGWAEAISPDASRVCAQSVGETAYAKAEAARDPISLEPGAYTVVLEPAAFAGILSIAGWTMQAKAAHEGRSAWREREGTSVGVPELTIRSLPTNPVLPGGLWIEQGLAAPDVTWISGGTLETLAYDRFWAAKCGKEPTGRPSGLVVSGTDATTEELIAGVERGVLVTRFWYIRFVDPMSLMITGMTRDGLFLIEDGKVTRGLRNMRFNDSPLSVFQSIERLGQAKPTALHGTMLAPSVVVRDFHFTSQTSF